MIHTYCRALPSSLSIYNPVVQVEEILLSTGVACQFSILLALLKEGSLYSRKLSCSNSSSLAVPICMKTSHSFT